MNITVFLLGALFGLLETNYFGWNLTPQSEAELVCDGITTLIIALAFLPATKAKENSNEQR